jgi:hypothetical protein
MFTVTFPFCWHIAGTLCRAWSLRSPLPVILIAPEAVTALTVPTSEFNYLRITPELHRRAVVPAAALGGRDKTVGQVAAAGQSVGHPVFRGLNFVLRAGFAGPASRQAFAEHRFVRLCSCKPLIGQLALVLMALVTHRGLGTVPIADVLSELAAGTCDSDHAVRNTLVRCGH